MRGWVRAACLAVATGALSSSAYEADVVVTYVDGRVEMRKDRLTDCGGNVFAWRQDRAALTGPVASIEVTPEFARARYSDRGWYVAGDGTRGFLKDRGKGAARKLWEASYQVLPFHGMKTPQTTFAAIATGMKYHAGVDYLATNGGYSVSFVFHEDMLDLYEEPAVEYHLFDDPKADYNEMAQAYRAWRFGQERIPSLAERAAKRPAVAYAAKYPEVRVRQAWKPVPATVNRQVPENEPKVTPYVSFARVAELAAACKARGVEGAEFCLVGWNRGGHDGAYPQLFPVEPSLGGEKGLRQCIAEVQKLGYAIVAHGNHTDAYMLADSWDAEYVKEKDASGGVVRPTETWGGGGKFTICPQRAYERFALRDAARVKALGFAGLYYLDVLTCRVQPACRDSRHPLTRAGIVDWSRRILDVQTDTFGGVSSEGACDAYVAHCDSVLTVCWSAPFLKEEDPKQVAEGRLRLFDDAVPLWELVYHGTVLYTPFRNIMNATANPDARYQLKLAEFGGRPTFYVHSRFKTYVSAAMGARDLRAVTDAELADSADNIARGTAEYARRAHLQRYRMLRHAEIRPGVFRTDYANGESLVANYNDAAVVVDGTSVPSCDYVLLER